MTRNGTYLHVFARSYNRLPQESPFRFMNTLDLLVALSSPDDGGEVRTDFQRIKLFLKWALRNAWQYGTAKLGRLVRVAASILVMFLIEDVSSYFLARL